MNIFYVSDAETGAQHAALALFPDGSLKMASDDVVQDPKTGIDFSKVPKPMLLPALTTTQRDGISSPTEGSEIYNKTTHIKQVFNGTEWKDVGADVIINPIATITGDNYDASAYNIALWTPTGNADLIFSNLPSGIDYNLIVYVSNSSHTLTIGGHTVPIAASGLTRITIDHISGIPYYESDYVVSSPSQWITAGSDIYYIAGKVLVGSTTASTSSHASNAALQVVGKDIFTDAKIYSDEIYSVNNGYGGIPHVFKLFDTDNGNAYMYIGREQFILDAATGNLIYADAFNQQINTSRLIAQAKPDGYNNSQIGLIVKGVSSQTDDILQIQDNSSTVLVSVDKDGKIISAQFKLTSLNTAPSNSTDTGVTGEIRVTSEYIYVCTATNTWVRTALTTW